MDGLERRIDDRFSAVERQMASQQDSVRQALDFAGERMDTLKEAVSANARAIDAVAEQTRLHEEKDIHTGSRYLIADVNALRNKANVGVAGGFGMVVLGVLEALTQAGVL